MKKSRKSAKPHVKTTDSALDHSLLAEPLKLGKQNVAQIAAIIANGTGEGKDLLLNESNIIYECCVCSNLYRNISNYLAHKRIYCKELQKKYITVMANDDSSGQSNLNSEPNSIAPTSSILTFQQQTNSQESSVAAPLSEPLNLGEQNVAQIAAILTNGTQEVKYLLLNECKIVYECRVCRNLFRSFANYVTHKRTYCKDHQCERMVLYDPSWFAPEQPEKEAVPEVVVTNAQKPSVVVPLSEAIGNPSTSTDMDAIDTNLVPGQPIVTNSVIKSPDTVGVSQSVSDALNRADEPQVAIDPEQYIDLDGIRLPMKLNRKELQCPIRGCNKRFKNQFFLNEHVRTHGRGYHPYMCTYAKDHGTRCGKTANLFANMTKHIKTHFKKESNEYNPEEYFIINEVILNRNF